MAKQAEHPRNDIANNGDIIDNQNFCAILLFWVNSEFTGCESSSTFDEAVKSFSGPAGPHIRKELCSGAKFCYFITRRIGK